MCTHVWVEGREPQGIKHQADGLQVIGVWQYIYEWEVARQLANIRVRMSQAIRYIASQPPQMLPGLANFRDIYREVEVDWWQHAASHCLMEVTKLIGMVSTEYQSSIARTRTTPANWVNVQRAL